MRTHEGSTDRLHAGGPLGRALLLVGLLAALLACKKLRPPPSGEASPPGPVVVEPGRGEPPATPTPPADPEKTGPGSGGVVPAGERLQWLWRADSVFPADIDGDAVEDFVGLYNVLDLATSTSTLHVGAFDGATLERIWGSPSLGTRSEGSGATHVGIAGGRVVVTDFRSRARVLAIGTGKELGAVTFSDKARSVCSPPDGRGAQVWIDVSDEQHVLLDVASLKATRGAAPPWCGTADERRCRTTGICFGKVDGPRVARVSSSRVIRSGPDAVLLGTKTPGTPVPIAVGFDPGTRVVRWQTAVAGDPATVSGSGSQPAALAGGALVTAYGVVDGGGWRLVALDARTGALRWEVQVPRSTGPGEVDRVVASSTRVYVPHWTWLEVFELATGKHVGTVGMW